MFNNKAKGLTILLVILIIIALSLSGGLYYLFQKEHTSNLGLTKQLAEVKEKQLQTEAKLSESQKMVVSLEDRVKDAQGKIDALTVTLQEEKDARQKATDEGARIKMELDQQKTLKSDLEKRLGQAEEGLKQSQGLLTELEAKKTELETKLRELEAKSRELEEKVKGIELGTIVVAPEAKQEKTNKKKSAAELKQEKEAKKQAELAKKAEEKAKKDAEKARKEADKLRLRAEKEEKARLANEAKKAKKTAEKEQKVVKPAASVPSNLEGSVVVVNKEYNFAVLNIGTKDGVKEGEVFAIYHDDNYIGDTRIEKVHDAMAAAGFITTDLKQKIVEGDRAVIQRDK